VLTTFLSEAAKFDIGGLPSTVIACKSDDRAEWNRLEITGIQTKFILIFKQLLSDALGQRLPNFFGATAPLGP
jgi:hypothetical protein